MAVANHVFTVARSASSSRLFVAKSFGIDHMSTYVPLSPIGNLLIPSQGLRLHEHAVHFDTADLSRSFEIMLSIPPQGATT